MTIRQATYSDVDALTCIFEQARKIMRESGNIHQWNDGYPSKEIIISDIDSGYCYLLCDEEAILATMALIPGPDPTYHVIHRIATCAPGRNVAVRMFDWAFGHIAGKGCNTIRIDTHRDNCIMKHILHKYGFKECGVIYLDDGSPRDAYICSI